MNTAAFPPAASPRTGMRLPVLVLGALIAVAGLAGCSMADERAADARQTQEDSQRDTMSHGATEY